MPYVLLPLAMLKYVKVAHHKSCSTSILSQKDIESAQKSVTKLFGEAEEEISENLRKQADTLDTKEHKDAPIVISELENK